MKSKLLKTKNILEVKLENDWLGSTVINGIQDLSGKLKDIIVKQEELFGNPRLKLPGSIGTPQYISEPYEATRLIFHLKGKIEKPIAFCDINRDECVSSFNVYITDNKQKDSVIYYLKI